jgi:CRP-like cAMP-binding protein
LDTRKSLTIFKPGDPCKSFFILVYGQVNEKLGTYDGYEDWRVIPQGSFFGTREYILKSPHRTLASASSPSLIYEISDTYCRTFLHKMFIESSKQENIFEVPYHFDLQSDSSSIHDFPSVLNSFNRYP